MMRGKPFSLGALLGADGIHEMRKENWLTALGAL